MKPEKSDACPDVQPDTWKEAVMASPGPESGRDALVLSLKGAAMGAADTVPGVSGGTVALITGIYEKLLAAIRSVDATFLFLLFRGNFKSALAHLHTRFLLFLFVGITAAVLSLARIVSHLLSDYPVLTWSLFFGLIAASVWSVGRKVAPRSAGAAVFFIAGGLFAWNLVGLVPAATPETLVFVFFSGMVAICAMILPGISGAFILVLLGKYEFIVATLRNPFLAENMIVIAVFVAGCGAGLAGFSRILKYLLERCRPLVLAFLTGLLLGSLRRIWPWKEWETGANMMPDISLGLLLPLGLMIAGACLIILLEWVSIGERQTRSCRN